MVLFPAPVLFIALESHEYQDKYCKRNRRYLEDQQRPSVCELVTRNFSVMFISCREGDGTIPGDSRDQKNGRELKSSLYIDFR